ncbi:MAG: glycosyltransferase [bacterium]|nr:glycosyltransferase [bacterium]
MTQPTFSIVVPAYDEEQYLPKCLDGIDAAAAYLGEPVEVIVVDNMSRDRTAAIAQEQGARVVREEAKCLAKIRNRGAAEAQGTYLAFIDADSIMSEKMLVRVKQALDSGGFVGGGVANVRADRISLGILCSAMVFFPVALWAMRASCVMFYTTPEAFRAVGGFNDELHSVEDIDFANRLRAMGKERGLRYKNMLRAHVTTSARKFDEFGDWFLVRRPWVIIKALRNDPKTAHDIWYRSRR